MCGIAGFVGPGNREALRRMAAALVHRGPDEEGFFETDGAGLAARRLSIIDVASGHQPAYNEEGTVAVVLNGEIYNHPSLRARLLKRGHRFATASDTEVLAHAYEEWGTGFLGMLNGMFALAVYDSEAKCLILSRDRYGVKPLYITHAGDIILFASEQRALLESGLVSARIDREALMAYLKYSYNRGAHTLFEGITKLAPGSLRVYERGRLKEEAYWDPKEEIRTNERDSTVKELGGLLEQVVTDQMISEVPVGVFLSGGLDSSTIALLARATAGKVSTFSVGFDEGTSELPLARETASMLDTDHHEFVIEFDPERQIPAMIRATDEPLVDFAVVPLLELAREANRYAKVILTGEGGDEVFGGYTRYVNTLAVRSQLSTVPPSATRLAARMLKPLSGGPRVSRLVYGLEVGTDEDRYLLRGNSTDARIRRLTATTGGPTSPDTPGELVVSESPLFPRGSSFLSRMQLADLTGMLRHSYLVKTDRALMAHSIEGRVPLLDNRIVPFGLALKDNLKISQKTTKVLLRKYLSGKLSDSVVFGPKRGFGVPVLQWWSRARDFAAGVLEEMAKNRIGLFDRAEIKRLAQARPPRDDREATFRWSLVCFELWAQAYLDGDLRHFKGVAEPYS